MRFPRFSAALFMGLLGATARPAFAYSQAVARQFLLGISGIALLLFFSFAVLLAWIQCCGPNRLLKSIAFFLNVAPAASLALWIFTQSAPFWNKGVFQIIAAVWVSQWLLYGLSLACWLAEHLFSKGDEKR
jgi:hypothetical protein